MVSMGFLEAVREEDVLWWAGLWVETLANVGGKGRKMEQEDLIGGMGLHLSKTMTMIVRRKASHLRTNARGWKTRLRMVRLYRRYRL